MDPVCHMLTSFSDSDLEDLTYSEKDSKHKAGCNGLLMYFSKLGKTDTDDVIDFQVSITTFHVTIFLYQEYISRKFSANTLTKLEFYHVIIEQTGIRQQNYSGTPCSKILVNKGTRGRRNELRRRNDI